MSPTLEHTSIMMWSSPDGWDPSGGPELDTCHANDLAPESSPLRQAGLSILETALVYGFRKLGEVERMALMDSIQRSVDRVEETERATEHVVAQRIHPNGHV